MKIFLFLVAFLLTILLNGCGRNASRGTLSGKVRASTEANLEQPKSLNPSAARPDSNQFVRITSPTANEQVVERQIVEGNVADPQTKVIVIVHPMEVEDYWVQPSVTVKEDRTWEVQVHIGRPGDIDVGKQFQIMAIANPREAYKTGQMLTAWPDSLYKSQVVRVTRKN